MEMLNLKAELLWSTCSSNWKFSSCN